LFTTPVIYLYLDRVSQWLSRGPRSTKPPEDARTEGPLVKPPTAIQAAE
jgi:hypothetical protein